MTEHSGDLGAGQVPGLRVDVIPRRWNKKAIGAILIMLAFKCSKRMSDR